MECQVARSGIEGQGPAIAVDDRGGVACGTDGQAAGGGDADTLPGSILFDPQHGHVTVIVHIDHPGRFQVQRDGVGRARDAARGNQHDVVALEGIAGDHNVAGGGDADIATDNDIVTDRYVALGGGDREAAGRAVGGNGQAGGVGDGDCPTTHVQRQRLDLEIT